MVTSMFDFLSNATDLKVLKFVSKKQAFSEGLESLTSTWLLPAKICAHHFQTKPTTMQSPTSTQQQTQVFSINDGYQAEMDCSNSSGDIDAVWEFDAQTGGHVFGETNIEIQDTFNQELFRIQSPCNFILNP